MKKLANKGQEICLSGVGDHNQNGGAEASVKTVVYKAIYIVIH